MSDIPVEPDTALPHKRRRVWWRLGLLVLLLGGIYAIGKTTGFLDEIDIDGIRRMVGEAGGWGMALYVALFAVGVLLQVPGMLFVATGMLLYGKLVGFLVCLFGAIVAVCASFLMVRAVGGSPLAAIERPLIRRMLARLERQPVRTLIALRLIAFIAPPLNYALALSSMRFRDYAIGSALGLVAPMAFMTFAFDWLFTTPWAAKWLFGQ